MEARGKLDQKSAAEWGGEPYTTMIQIGQEADAHFMGKQYRAAADKYTQAAGMAAELADRTNDILLRLLEEGSGALNAGDGSLAQSKFTVALMIEPSNPTAQRGLKRAKTIETVMQLVASGKQHEQNNALSSAQADYLKALEIDSDANEARKGLNRVKGLLKAKQFQRLISEGLAAFHHNDYQLARTRLLKAKSLKPESRQVLDALAQVDQAIRLASIDTLRQQAQSDERSENWQSALKSYLAVLKIDKNVQFATRGKERALEQIRTNKRIDFFLAKPEVLASDSQLNNAVLLLNESKELKPQGPKMTARIKKLEELVSIAQKPLKITIESDNLTDIAVYKVGKLGRFSVRELELRPGTYTVVGTRDGYQDVRQKIEVKPGRQLLRVTIKCRVKI